MPRKKEVKEIIPAVASSFLSTVISFYPIHTAPLLKTTNNNNPYNVLAFIISWLRMVSSSKNGSLAPFPHSKNSLARQRNDAVISSSMWHVHINSFWTRTTTWERREGEGRSSDYLDAHAASRNQEEIILAMKLVS